MSTPIFSWAEHEAPDRAYYLTRQLSAGPYSYRSHTHTGQTEVVVVVRGRLEHVLNGRLFVLEPGMAQLVREPDSHSLRGAGLEFYNLAFPSPTTGPWGAFLRSGPEDRWNWLVSAPLHPPFPFTSLGLGAPEDLLLPLCDRYDPWLFLRLMASVFETVTRAAAPPAGLGGYVFVDQPGTSPVARTLSALPSWMSDLAAHLSAADKVPSAADLPGLTGFTASHLSRSFQKHWGLSPSAYLNRVRLDRAAALIRRNGASAGVSRAVGFANSNYFHKLFRERFGVSPRHFRHGNRYQSPPISGGEPLGPEPWRPGAGGCILAP